MTKQKAIFNWSGGKDSSLALYHLLKDQSVEVTSLLTSISTAHERISMHGVRKELLYAQGEAIGLPIRELRLPESPSMSEYNELLAGLMRQIRAEGITHSAFGDIFLEDLKLYREERLAEVDMQAIFPLWLRDTRELIEEFIDLGFKTVVVCVKASLLDESFVGRVIDHDFLRDLPEGVDPCGENGEFHTFVFDGPIFKQPVAYALGETVYREYKAPKDDQDTCVPGDRKVKRSGYYFKDLVPVSEHVS